MRRRLNPRRKNIGVSKGIIFGIIFAILLPIGAIYIGLKITENWIVPVFDSKEILGENDAEIDFTVGETENSENTHDDSSELTEVGDINPVAIYAIQVASVTDKSNIENLIGELNDRELSHLIYNVDNKFKVFTYGSTKRSFVESKIEDIRAHYPDAFITEMYLPKKTIKYHENESLITEIIEDINHIIEVIDKQSEEWYNYGGTITYKELLNKHDELLNKLNEKINDEKFSEAYFSKNVIEKSVMYQQSNINTSLEILESKEKEYRIHSLFLDSLFRVVELIK